MPVEDLVSLDSTPRINRIGVQEDYEAFIEELKDDITEELRGMY